MGVITEVVKLLVVIVYALAIRDLRETRHFRRAGRAFRTEAQTLNTTVSTLLFRQQMFETIVPAIHTLQAQLGCEHNEKCCIHLGGLEKQLAQSVQAERDLLHSCILLLGIDSALINGTASLADSWSKMEYGTLPDNRAVMISHLAHRTETYASAAARAQLAYLAAGAAASTLRQSLATVADHCDDVGDSLRLVIALDYGAMRLWTEEEMRERHHYWEGLAAQGMYVPPRRE